MTGSLLLRGMLIGVLAGVLAFFFAYKFGEPQIDLAIAFEEQMSAAEDGAEEETELVSRTIQAGVGLATGLIIYGAAIGGIFSLVFAFAYGRFGEMNARTTSALLALAAFMALVAVPLLKYPANPPAVGSDDTIGVRTLLFLIMIVLSVAIMAGSSLLARRLRPTLGSRNSVITAGAVYVGLVAILYIAMPPINEMPDGFSPEVLWNFRISAMGIHIILWTVIGLGFGLFAQRQLEAPGAKRSVYS